MDTIQNLQNLPIEISASDNDRKKIFSKYFTSGYTTSSYIGDKFELLKYLSYLTFECKKRFPEKFKNSLDVIEFYIEKRKLDDRNLYDRYLIGLSIVCDDLLDGTDTFIDMPKIGSEQIVQKIKYVLDQWIPF